MIGCFCLVVIYSEVLKPNFIKIDVKLRNCVVTKVRVYFNRIENTKSLFSRRKIITFNM